MDEALSQIEASGELEKLNDIRVAFLGKKGELTSVLKGMKDVAPEDRPKVGQLVNEARTKIEAKLEEKKETFEKKLLEEKLKSETIDVTLPGKKLSQGHRHPNTITLEEVEDIFSDIECILLIFCRMVCRNIQCFKVIVIIFYFRSFHNLIPHSYEDIFYFFGSGT